MQAGRLEVPVVASLKGFASELRTKVEAAAKGLSAKVSLAIDAEGLRERLETAVEEASAGITAKIRVEIDQSRLRAELEEVARQVGRTDLTVPVRADEEEGGRRGGLLERIRSLLQGAQGEADRSPVQVPVEFKLPGRRRSRMRGLLLGAIIALAQPAVAWIGQVGAGLTALASAAAPAVGILGTLPGLLAGAGIAAISTRVAFGGLGDALKQTFKAQAQLAAGAKLTEAQQRALDQSMEGLSKSARKTVKEISGVSDAWKGLRRSVQERLFAPVADEVKPLSDKLLPRFQAAMGSSASQVGAFFRQMAKGAQTKSFARDFDQVAASSNRVTGSLIRGLKNTGHAVGDFVVSSGPAVERISALTEGWTEWLRAATESNRADGSIDRFLQRSIDKTKQLLRATVDMGHGLAGVGRAARSSGESLLQGLEFQMRYFNAWANSAKGQTRMKAFFDASLPVYRETIGLLGDIGKGLGRMATDDSTLKLVRQIRYELVPAVGSFVNQLGRLVGPQLISLFAGLAGVFEKLSAAGLGLAVIVEAFAALAVGANSLMQTFPALGTAIGGLIGMLLALKVLRGVTTLVTGMGAAVARTSTTMAAAPGRIQAVTGAWQRAGLVYQRVAQQSGGLTGAARGATAATRVMGRGLSGMLGIVGGPLGLALGLGSIALMAFADRQQEAAQAAAEHRAQVQSLVDALRSSNGAIDENVVAQARKLAVESDWGRAAAKANVSTRELTQAILGQGTSLEQLEKKLRAAADDTLHWEDVAGGKASVRVMTEQGKAALAAADAIKEHGTSLKDARKELEDTGQLQDAFAKKAVTAYDRVRDAVQRLADSTGDAESRTSALKSLIEALSGKTRSYAEATQKLNARLLEMQEYAKSNKDVAKGKKVVSNGMLDTSSALGQDLYRLSSGLADDALSKVQAAFDNAASAGKPLVERLAAARAEAVAGREALIGWLGTLGVGAVDAAKIADQMGLIPETVVTGLKLEGQDAVAIALAGIQAQFVEYKNPKSVTVSVLDQAAREKLTSLGFQVKDLPDGRFKVIAATETARGKLAGFIDTANNMPANKKVEVAAQTAKAQQDLEAVKGKVATFKDKPFTMKALTADAVKVLKELGYKVEAVPGAKGAKQIKITAPPGTVYSNVGSIQGAINGLRGKTITVDVAARFGDGFNSDGSVHVSGMGRWANGGILKFAEGGLYNASRSLKRFAHGTERHIAQIARAGEMRLWAEPETAPGEAYIPLAPSKRKRSAEILDTVARFFGGMVVYPQDDQTSHYANGAIRLHDRSRSLAAATATPRASTAQTPAALVGGDLNLTMTAAPMSPGEALNETMFELRRIRRGGAHAGG
jgi:hypothetical protein